MKTDKVALLETALKLFHERGFQSVTIYDIGAAVGVTGAALYRHFRSKGDVLGLLCEMTLDRLTECTGPRREDPRDELRALIRGQVHFVVQHPKLLLVTMFEGRALEEPWRATIERRQRAHLKRWKSALAGLHPDEDLVNLDVAIYGAIGLINSATRWPPALRSRPDFESRLVAGAHLVIDTFVKVHAPDDA
ncbi:TetR/AcrR family transcriptional regulator [Bradyrhizobium sp. USDA 4502]